MTVRAIRLGLLVLLAGCGADFHFAHSAGKLRSFDADYEYVSIRGLPDEDVAELSRFHALHSVDFGGGWKAYPLKSTSAGFATLADLDLPDLRIITMQHCPSIDDECLRQVGRMPGLAHVDLRWSTGFTAEGLAHVLALPEISALDVRGCAQIDDGWVASLATCRTLTQLGVAATSISPDGVARLRAALPDCHVDDEIPYIEVTLDRAHYPGWAGPPERKGR